jgi:hypothetical protein
MRQQTISALEEGASAQVTGVVRVADPDLLDSPLSHEACVYWDVRRGVGEAPERRDARDFWVGDDTGRVLVRAEGVRVNAKADRRETLIKRLEADIEVVSTRIKEVKRRMHGLTSDKRRELARERKRLAKIATVLCAIRADANGNIHVGGSPRGQRDWIASKRHLLEAEEGLTSKEVEVEAERWEVVLAPGQRVSLQACFVMRPLPGNVPGAQGGYRGRASCLTAEPLEAGGVVEVRGEGAAAPHPHHDETDDAGDDGDVATLGRAKPSALADPILRATALLTAGALVLTYLIMRLLR